MTGTEGGEGMTDKEAMEEMEGMIKDADRLTEYLKENPDAAEALQ